MILDPYKNGFLVAFPCQVAYDPSIQTQEEMNPFLPVPSKEGLCGSANIKAEGNL
jgi:hypothetical protein